MREVFILLFVCSALGILYDKSCRYKKRGDSTGHGITRMPGKGANLIFFILLLIMVIFAGTRTVMNDTAVYLKKFAEIPNSLSAIKDVDLTLGNNPLFVVYRIVFKALVSEDGHLFILFTSTLVVSSYLLFLKKHAFQFGYSLFILIGFTVYAFTMAAIKQTMATAIAIWMIPDIIHGKKLRPLLLLAVAMMIHPYVIIFLSAFLFGKKIWDSKTVLMLLATLAIGALFSTFMSSVLKFTSSIGDEYDVEMFTGNAVSVMRLLVYLVIPVTSFVARNNIREEADSFTLMAINLSIVSSCFMIIASFGGANMFGRLANYMDIFQCMALPAILYYGYRDKHTRALLVAVSVVGYTVFYYIYYSKYSSMGDCFYAHISIFDLLRIW